MLDPEWRSSHDGAVLELLRSLWSRATRETVSERRRLRLKLMLLEKRGKGGKR
jgi:hypothetical protein